MKAYLSTIKQRILQIASKLQSEQKFNYLFLNETYSKIEYLCTNEEPRRKRTGYQNPAFFDQPYTPRGGESILNEIENSPQICVDKEVDF